MLDHDFSYLYNAYKTSIFIAENEMKFYIR